MRDLPPLKALVAFDAVARHLSFSKAGNELGLTQSAVSHRLRLLEDNLGETLFVRQGRLLALTDIGRSYANDVDRILGELSSATSVVKGKSQTCLRFAVYSSFAMKWLVPELPNFRAMFPEVDLRLKMVAEDPELSDRVADIFVTVSADKPGYHKLLLHKERLLPVVSPDLYQEMKLVDPLTEIFQYPLLSVESHAMFGQEGDDWRVWSEQAGTSLPEHSQMHFFSHLILAVEAAINGQGIALASDFMVQKDIVQGRLIRLPLPALDSGFDFFFCCKQRRLREPGIQAVANWLAGLASGVNVASK